MCHASLHGGEVEAGNVQADRPALCSNLHGKKGTRRSYLQHAHLGCLVHPGALQPGVAAYVGVERRQWASSSPEDRLVKHRMSIGVRWVKLKEKRAVDLRACGNG